MKRIASLDKLDKINYYSKMHTNLVKWWDVNITDPAKIPVDGEGCDGEELPDKALTADDDYDADAVAQKLLDDALTGDYDPGDYDQGAGASSGEEIVSSGDPEVDAAAMEIYNRLMSEAAADEAAKIAEIEAAKLKAQEDGV